MDTRKLEQDTAETDLDLSAPLRDVRPADLPAPPEAALEVMRACAEEGVNSHRLADLVSKDPVLSAELLRIVNSPFYGLSREIGNIKNAVTILGQANLRNLVLCIAVRDSLRSDQLSGMDPSDFWEEALRRAVAARLLAGYLKLDKDECFTAGLLQDFGLLVLMHLYPDRATLWSEMKIMAPDERYGFELKQFGITHDRIIMMLAQAWSLPQNMVRQLGMHHRYEEPLVPEAEKKYVMLLACADWMAASYSAADTRYAVTVSRGLLHEAFSLGTRDADDLLAQLPEQVEEASQALGLRVLQAGDYDQIMNATNVELAEQNLEYQYLTMRLQKILKERDQLASELDREMRLAREVQSALLPAGNDNLPVAGINLPARELSGDFYDYFQVPDVGVYFCLADVSGKGANAALLMAKTSSLFHCLGKLVRHPSELLAQINDEICETATHGMFVTMVAGLYKPDSDELILVNAGHMPALLIDTNCGIHEVDAQAHPLGILPVSEFPAITMKLGNNSLYLYTDGLTEGHMSNGEMLDKKGLVKMLCSLHELKPLDRLKAVVSQFGSEEQALHDDISLLVLEAARD